MASCPVVEEIGVTCIASEATAALGSGPKHEAYASLTGISNHDEPLPIQLTTHVLPSTSIRSGISTEWATQEQGSTIAFLRQS